MFVGSVPKQAAEQIVRVVPFAEWGRVWVGCSGSFRVDRAVAQAFPGVAVHSNDVSQLSCSLGALATGASFDIRFKGRLGFVEDHLRQGGFAERAAAVQVALEMAKYKGANAFAEAHFAHYRERFDDFLAPAVARIGTFLQGLRIAGFHAGDFRDQARRAAEQGGGVLAFPPTYKNGYERLYKFVDEGTDWARPSYGVWDPARLEEWLDELDGLRVRYCVLTDHRLDRHSPVTVFRGASNKPVYTYADRARSSVRRASGNAAPFRYDIADPAALGPQSRVEIVEARAPAMNFLKNIYLAKGIAHVPGIASFLVLTDGKLAGGFIYQRDKFGEPALYLLSDFALVPRSKLSKLVAMLATSEALVRLMEVRTVRRIEAIKTTAFTDGPVSMKYRGIFDLESRKPGKLNYASKVRRQSPQQIYDEWFARFVVRAARPSDDVCGTRSPRDTNARHKGAPVRPAVT